VRCNWCSQALPTHFNTEHHDYQDTHAAGCDATPIDTSASKQTKIAKAAILSMGKQHGDAYFWPIYEYMAQRWDAHPSSVTELGNMTKAEAEVIMASCPQPRGDDPESFKCHRARGLTTGVRDDCLHIGWSPCLLQPMFDALGVIMNVHFASHPAPHADEAAVAAAAAAAVAERAAMEVAMQKSAPAKEGRTQCDCFAGNPEWTAFDAKHDQWESRLEFTTYASDANTGGYKRSDNGDSGVWLYEPDAERLTLTWDKWGQNVLAATTGTPTKAATKGRLAFANDHLRVEQQPTTHINNVQ
jgi:hypothetical protein